MAQQQINYHPQTASQYAGGQQWGDNSGATINNYHNVGTITYYGGHAYMQGPVTAYTVQNGGPVRQTPSPSPPGFAHMGHGVQHPPFSGTNVQSHMAHVCGSGKGPFTAQEKQILRGLCSSVVERSNHTRDCNSIGRKVTRESIDHFIAGDEKAANKHFWRQGQKNKSQRKCRAEKKQQKDQAKQPDRSQQWSATTPVYHQQMQVVEDNAGCLQDDLNVNSNGMLPDYTVEGHIGIQMQEEAQQDLLQEWVHLDLDAPVDPQLAL